MLCGMSLEQVLDGQAQACERLGAPLYAELLRRAADDVRAGGILAEALAGYESTVADDAVPLRLLGAVHALVLTGQAPALAAYYPSAGGRFDPAAPEGPWPAFREVVAGHLPHVRRWLTRPPQTNEVGRANLLIAGLLRASHAVGPLPVRLLELGSSAGLNLRPDRFRYEADGLAWGPADSPVRLTGAWRGPAPRWLTEAAAARPELRLAERRGCDLHPVDPLSEAGALALRAYVWPDQTDRLSRLDGALRLARREPVTVEAIGAADFLTGVRLRPGALTVVWHSVFRQYVADQEWRRAEAELDRLAAEATPEAPFAYLAFEPARVAPGRVRLTLRLGSAPAERLAEARPHGLPAWVRP